LGRVTPEKRIQDDILNFLNTMGIFAWHARNGATYDPRKGIYRRNTSVKGIADIIGILHGGRFLAIEVKTPKGKVSPHQHDFLLEINYRGGLGIVARSLDDVINALNEYSSNQKVEKPSSNPSK
jgi:hypothetical protein